MTSSCLFVYGTLKTDHSNPMAQYLKENSELLGLGTMPGTIFDLDDYPGAVHDPSAGSSVSGQVFRLKNPVEVLQNLDKYEGVGKEFDTPNEYRREEVPIKMGRKLVSCWVYLYNLPLPEKTPSFRIAS